MVQLFDYVKILFTGKEQEWNDLKNTDKSRNFFMSNRFLSIKYPVQVSLLSHIKISPPAVADYWHLTLKKLYKTVPTWIYAKVKKGDKEKKQQYPSEEMIKWFCSKEEMSRNEFDTHVKFFRDEFLDEILSLEKTLKSQGYFKS
jgi:hypothetical protein